jgi:hypothetical protein
MDIDAMIGVWSRVTPCHGRFIPREDRFGPHHGQFVSRHGQCVSCHGLVLCHGRAWPSHPRLAGFGQTKSWVAGPSPAMTWGEGHSGGEQNLTVTPEECHFGGGPSMAMTRHEPAITRQEAAVTRDEHAAVRVPPAFIPSAAPASPKGARV